ncbi:glucoamylase family protein [Sphingomonas sp. STIS6.2]|uniref:glucoamylase family protein n=1 Tax=Sphingomonas sp. STIS6.2 TaxID=1379700 RepID=UPI0004DB76F8|nr:glucoamylase family protein [Sphingomonas sp. STIS6.2]
MTKMMLRAAALSLTALSGGVLFAPAPAAAQVGQASLRGTITAPADNPVVEVTPVEVATGLRRTVPADAAGGYNFASLRAGTYAIANPEGWVGYGPDVWGLTACDGPGDFAIDIGGRRREFFSYAARGVGDRDDGTLAPTAAAASIAFEPELSSRAIETMHARYGARIYGKYGFLDSFNPTLTATSVPLKHGSVDPAAGWVDDDYLGIDQGAIVVMMENWRTGLVWTTMRRNPHIRRGLQRAGFTGGWLT